MPFLESPFSSPPPSPPPPPYPSLPLSMTGPFSGCVLLEIFSYLDGMDLIMSSRVCHFWRGIIFSSSRLLEKSFYDVSVPRRKREEGEEKINVKDIELHPFFRKLHFDNSLSLDELTYGGSSSSSSVSHKVEKKYQKQKYRRLRSDDPVNSQLATVPRVPILRLDVLKYHPNVVVKNPDGVRVRDVLVELDRYKKEITNIAFHEFYGNEICVLRGYPRRKQMARYDMLGEAKLVAAFSTEPSESPIDGAPVWSTQDFVRVDDGMKSRFWSSFAFPIVG